MAGRRAAIAGVVSIVLGAAPALGGLAPPRQPPSVGPPGVGAGRHLPDLVALPAWDVKVGGSVVPTVGEFMLASARTQDPYAGDRKSIRFGVTFINAGRYSLEIVGVPAPNANRADPVRVKAFQCVRFTGPAVLGTPRGCAAHQEVGSLVFHAQHGHLHIDGFAQYWLLRDRGGRPDDTPAGVVSRAEKVGFCMADTDWRGAPQGGDNGWYRECRHTTPHVPVTFRQGVSPAWGDSYGPDLPGQHLPIDKVPDGVYWIAVTVNPGTPKTVNIREATRVNNTSYRRIQLSGNGTQVKEL